MKNKDTKRQILTVFAIITTIAMNGVSNTGIFNNADIGELSDKYTTFFIPAGYVFSIWAVIYTGMLAYGIYQAQKPQKENSDLRGIYGWFLLSCVANIAWLIVWLYQWVTLSLILMLVMLVSLIAIYLKLGIGRKPVSRGMKWCVHVPFSIYLGWITVATVANVTTWSISMGWDGWGIAPQTWSVTMMAVATLVGILMSLRHGDIAYVGVIVWAFIGIFVAYNAQSSLVGITALALASVAAGSLFVTVPSKRKKLRMALN